MHEMQTIVTDVSGVCPSVSMSRMHRMTLHGEADLRLCFTVQGHSVQPLPNHFGLLFLYNPFVHLFYHCFKITASMQMYTTVFLFLSTLSEFE